MDSPFDPGVGTVEEDLEKLFQQLEKFTSRFSALQ
jgi:adenylate kinase